MPKSILVATPDGAFGELLRSSLMEKGDYNIQLVQTGTDVLASISSLVFDLAFLDAEIKDQPVELLIDAVRIKLPGIKVIVIPPPDKEDYPSAGDLGADGLLKKPFYAPDLVSITEGIFSGKSPEKPAEPKSDMPFDDIVLPVTELATQENLLEKDELVKWFSESSALAAVIIKGESMIASVGDLGDATLHELIKDIQGRLTPGSREELIRFRSLGSAGQERLIYAVHLTPELTGISVYEVATLFSAARAESSILSQALAKAAVPGGTLAAAAGTWAPEHAIDSAASISDLQGTEKPSETVQPEEPSGGELKPQPVTGDGENSPEKEIQEIPDGSSSETPEISPDLAKSDAQISLENRGENPEPGVKDEGGDANVEPSEKILTDESQPQPEILEDKSETLGTELKKSASDSLSEIDLIAAITPEQPDLAKTAELAPASTQPPREMVHQSFILVPGDPKTFLTGNLADDLAQWLPEICAAHQWDLDAIALRPVYVQITVAVPEYLSSQETIKTLRNESSDYIFLKYPNRKPTGKGQDFWAEEHLEFDREKPVSQHDLRIFINRMHG